jgi:hypothetical protein
MNKITLAGVVFLGVVAAGCAVEPAGVPAVGNSLDAAAAPAAEPAPGGETPAVAPDAGATVITTPVVADAAVALPRTDASAAPSVPPAPPPDAAPLPPDAAPPVVCPSDRSDLVVCLPFEGSVTNVVAQPLTVTSKNIAFMPGPMGQAASLGSDSGIRVSESPVLDGQSLTVEAWLSPRSLPGRGGRAGIVDNDLEYSMFLGEGGAITCSVGLIAVTAPAVVSVGAWTSVACTYDASAITVYVDGAQVAEGRSAPINVFGLAGVTIGQNNPGGDNYDGLIDNVRVWRLRRTPAEICASSISCR